VTEREYCRYRDTRNPACLGNSLPEPPLGQAEEVPAKYGLLHERTEGDSDPGILPFERRAFVKSLKPQCYRKTADRAEDQSLPVLPSASPVPMKELEPMEFKRPRLAHANANSTTVNTTPDLKRMNRRREHDPASP
jgi:hypothetical protein